MTQEIVERIRENLKQSAKNTYTCDITVEFKNGDTLKIGNKDDLADIKTKDIETELWERLERMQKIGRDKGLIITGDN